MNTTSKRHPVDTSLGDQYGSTLKPWFFQHLRVLLGSLYDPSILGKSPLLEWLHIPSQPDSITILRKFLIDAIDSLKPIDTTPRGMKSIRVYEILRQRYIEQHTQRKVADNIGLSARQLQREDKIAVDTLGETIWRAQNFQDVARLNPGLMPTPQTLVPAQSSPGQQQDLDWLRTTTPAQPTILAEEIQDIIATLKSVMTLSKIRISFKPELEDPRGNLYLQAPILRQGLLNILSICISLAAGGQIGIRMLYPPKQVKIRIVARSDSRKKIQLDASQIENLDFAASLISLCEGTFHTSLEDLSERTSGKLTAEFISEIILPASEPITVLFIDDNADTLELYRRFLVNSRYRFVGASDTRKGFSLACELTPRVIVLDVMMPEKDGWSFLGQLKIHPEIQNIPVIISSVLQQANLAQTLGAAEFLHKPVSRVDLLSCLDRQMERLATKSH
jgi:CheY-like chemotaxis protein